MHRRKARGDDEGEEADDAQDTFNPFEDGGGVLESNVYVMVSHPKDGPTDLRISALGSIDPRKWFPGFGDGAED